MQYRGPILLVFGLSLVASPLAIQLAKRSHQVVPAQVVTVGAAQAECAARTIETSSYVIGCRGRQMATDNRRTMTGGGAMFVRVNN